MSKEMFTNRHGKTVTVDDDEVVVDQPSVQAPSPTKRRASRKVKQDKATEPESAAPIFEAEPLEPVIVEPRRRRFRSIHFGRIAKTVVGMLIIAVVTFVLMTQTAAQQYSDAEHKMKTVVRQASEIKLKTEVGLPEALTQLSAALPAIRCPQPGMFELSGQSREAHQRCEVTQRTYDAIRKEVQELQSIATYTNRLTEIMTPSLANPSDGNFADISAYADAWLKSEQDIKAMSAPGRVSKGHSAVVNAVITTSGAWQKLRTANNARDGEGYSAAKAELSAAYETLKTASDQILVDLLPYQKSLSNELSLLR